MAAEQFGNAESAGRSCWSFRSSVGEPIRASADYPAGFGENDVAKVGAQRVAGAGWQALQRRATTAKTCWKKHHGERDFIVTVVENSVQGVRIGVGAE